MLEKYRKAFRALPKPSVELTDCCLLKFSRWNLREDVGLFFCRPAVLAADNEWLPPGWATSRVLGEEELEYLLDLRSLYWIAEVLFTMAIYSASTEEAILLLAKKYLLVIEDMRQKPSRIALAWLCAHGIVQVDGDHLIAVPNRIFIGTPRAMEVIHWAIDGR